MKQTENITSIDPRTSSASKLMEYSAVMAILLLFGLFLAHKQDISISDVGRHIRNGEFFFKDSQVLFTNFYSNTESGFPALNHHWGTGVLFYVIWRMVGFDGLHIFYVALYLLSFGIFFRIAIKKGGLVAAGLSALLVIPLLAQRPEIRPEGFSYVFAGLFLWLLGNWRERKGSMTHLLILLPILEVLWVNLHIYFIFGLFIVGVFWLDSVYCSREYARKLFLLLLLTTFATVLNPFGIQGALAPFTIFKNYGITVAENDPVWVIDRYFGIFSYDTLNIKVVTALLLLTFVLAALKRPREIPLPYILFAAVYSVMAWLAIRNMVLLGLFSVPIMATNIAVAGFNPTDRWRRIFLPAVLLVLAISVALYSNGMVSTIFRLYPETGFGMAKGNAAAAEFFKKNGLRGPLFNNFDAGGYLIYYLFPDERVFIDNRPEAYPNIFTKQIYTPMLLSENVWNDFDSRIDFQTIVLRKSMDVSFFANARMNDPKWQQVYDDPFFVMFTKRMS